jgi:plastocyanin
VNRYIYIYDNYFDPQSIKVPIHWEVTWVNKGEVIHNVTGDWGDSWDLQPGASWQVTFNEGVGKTFWYYDENYQGMEGNVVVTKRV